jgi:hypothetical protein
MSKLLNAFRPFKPPYRDIAAPALRAAAALLFFTLALLELPVNHLSITGDGVLLEAPLGAGAPFVTSYIHSVERTPVIDEYRIVLGRIWSWEELVKSHNAGLPFGAQEHGSFIVGENWMIVRGSRASEETIAYRVGNAELGRNRWRLPPFFIVDAWEKFPSRRVYITASIKKFRDARLTGWRQAEDIPKQ